MVRNKTQKTVTSYGIITLFTIHYHFKNNIIHITVLKIIKESVNCYFVSINHLFSPLNYCNFRYLYFQLRFLSQRRNNESSLSVAASLTSFLGQFPHFQHWQRLLLLFKKQERAIERVIGGNVSKEKGELWR